MTDKSYNAAENAALYQHNITPGVVEYLADTLGVSAQSLTDLGVGYYYAKQVWTFPERNHKGEIIGVAYRFADGRKGFEPGGKRGLTFVVNARFMEGHKAYTPGAHNWLRVSDRNGITCPLCNHTDWCMVSADNPENPAAVICGRVKEGSVKECGDGYLHILKPEADYTGSKASVLRMSELPVLIVEGPTDVAAGLDLGFEMVGKPGARACLNELRDLPLAGRDVVIFGEHDAGAGIEGMEATFRTLKPVTATLRKVLPISGFKDLRKWVVEGKATQASVLKHIKENASDSMSADIFDDDIASTIARQWLTQQCSVQGRPSIRSFRGDWVKYIDGRYQFYDEDILRGDLYQYLEGKLYQKEDQNGKRTLAVYKPTRAKLNDVFDALNQWCPISQEPPSWLDDDEHPRPADLVFFKNGLLDLNEYAKGVVKLYEPTPAFFSFNSLPYNFDEDAQSPLWSQFLDSVFSSEAQKALLAEWFGYNLVPDTSLEKMMVLVGVPRSGKSTILDTMRAMLGVHQCCETSFQSLVSPFGFAPLVGKLAALIGDAKTPRASEADSALEKLLQITGGDPVTVNRKNLSQLTSIKLYCRFTLAMNDLPAFTDFSRALEYRLNVLHFTRSFIGKEDRSLKWKLMQEAASGKLTTWALKGLAKVRKEKQFVLPMSSAELMDEFREVSNPVVAFMRECAVVTKDASFFSVDQLYDMWQVWCRGHGMKCGNKAWFIKKVWSAFPQLGKERKRVGEGDRAYVFTGMKCTKEALRKYLGRP